MELTKQALYYLSHISSTFYSGYFINNNYYYLFIFAVLGLELRVYALIHSTNNLLGLIT
jgi:hypothetical protein